jgi:serine/threonine protein kinase
MLRVMFLLLSFHICSSLVSTNVDASSPVWHGFSHSKPFAHKSTCLIRIRGGHDFHTGKFVLEHRNMQSGQNLTKLQDIYEIQDLLGEGGFATVRRAIHKQNRNVYAVKSIDICKIKSNTLDFLRNEISIMKMLDHPNVIKLYEIFEEENRLHLVLEMCEGGDLFDFLMKTTVVNGEKIWTDGNLSFVWTEARLAELARKMLSAVAYLHQRGIAHRSLPPRR